MPIDRTPFNALVDDNGTNTIGSPWNKAAIAGVILDPVDAAIGGVWVDVAYNAANFSVSGTGSWGTVAPATNAYMVSGKTLTWALYFINWSITGTPTSLDIVIPGGFTPARNTGGTFATVHGGGARTGWWVTTGNKLKFYTDIIGTPWVAGVNHLSGIFTLNVV